MVPARVPRQPLSEGDTSWHHLWFIVYLYVYCLALLPLMHWWRNSQRARDAWAAAISRPGGIFLLAIPSFLLAITLGPHWPVTNNLTADWANLTISGYTFFAGQDRIGQP